MGKRIMTAAELQGLRCRLRSFDYPSLLRIARELVAQIIETTEPPGFSVSHVEGAINDDFYLLAAIGERAPFFREAGAAITKQLDVNTQAFQTIEHRDAEEGAGDGA